MIDYLIQENMLEAKKYLFRVNEMSVIIIDDTEAYNNGDSDHPAPIFILNKEFREGGSTWMGFCNLSCDIEDYEIYLLWCCRS